MTIKNIINTTKLNDEFSREFKSGIFHTIKIEKDDSEYIMIDLYSKPENNSMETLKNQKWTALTKALLDEQIKRDESLLLNGYIIYLDDMKKIRNEQRKGI